TRWVLRNKFCLLGMQGLVPHRSLVNEEFFYEDTVWIFAWSLVEPRVGFATKCGAPVRSQSWPGRSCVPVQRHPLSGSRTMFQRRRHRFVVAGPEWTGFVHSDLR